MSWTWNENELAVAGERVAVLSESPDAWPSRRWCWLVRRPNSPGWEAGGRLERREDAEAEAETELGELGVRFHPRK